MSKIPQALIDRYFFHFTHVENLESIAKNGLLCTNHKKELSIEHINLASESIQERRSTMKVTCGPRGVVHDYVPFYFCSVNPMFLSMLNTKNVDQSLIIIFAIPIRRLENSEVVFTNASANTNIPPQFYDSAKSLNELDWEEIDNLKWKTASEEKKHRRMAEVLIHKSVPLTDIEYIIVWNQNIKDEIKKYFEKSNIQGPKITFSPFKNNYKFHFTKFMFVGRELETLITGPSELLKKFKSMIKLIKRERDNPPPKISFPYRDIEDCLVNVNLDFSSIKELKGIYKLETDNEVHKENVSDHTLLVVKKLKNSEYYRNADNLDRSILEFSAYLHDIGKGPASKWRTGRQSTYPDHPVDSLKMLRRVLVEDIEEISNYEIRKVCLLVAYHDLIGEILGKERNENQLINLIKDDTEFDMLSALNLADVQAIGFTWAFLYKLRIAKFRDKILKKLADND